MIATNYAGLFICPQGYINISAVPFNEKADFSQKKMHITNYVLDGEFANISQMSTEDLPDFAHTWQKMKAIIEKIFRALIQEYPHYLCPQNHKAFEIFGFDFMLDAQKRLWLLEINQSPDAPTFEANQLFSRLWAPFWHMLVEDFVLPIAESRTKNIQYPALYQSLPPNTVCPWWRRVFSVLSK